MGITILTEEIANQIAAGEVIENPSAVVKELVENAIDAEATSITISLEQSGLQTIAVKDNGTGMEKEDLLKAPQRHATSKIETFNDLYSISTMGFRGEALASIFSVAQTTLISKNQKQSTGYQITSKQPTEVNSIGCSQGTNIIVENLFYNTPARKKYLKSQTMELRDIMQVTKRFELSYPMIEFKVVHNGSLLVHKPTFNTQAENLEYVLGKEIRGTLLEVSKQIKGITVTGHIANPTEISYSYKKNQYFFVNGRYITSTLLTNALYNGIGSNLMVGKHPSFVIFISIDPEIIDVNVHPTKTQIRFENEQEIFEIISGAIKEVFESKPLFREFDTKLTVEDSSSKNYSSKFNNESPYFSKEFQKHFEVEETKIHYTQANSNKDSSQQEYSNNNFASETYSLTYGPLSQELSDYKILGQLDKTYIVVETKTGLLLVDQHIAEEKYFYEKMIYDNSFNTTKQQQLLKPYIISLDNSEMLNFKEHSKELEKLGFEIEDFGEQEVIIRAVPITLGHKTNHPDRLKEMLYSILSNKTIKCVEDENHAKIASIACRSAIMAGDELSYPQMRKLIENLKFLQQPFQCPHGRPTFLKYDFKELEKKFKRIV